MLGQEQSLPLDLKWIVPHDAILAMIVSILLIVRWTIIICHLYKSTQDKLFPTPDCKFMAVRNQDYFYSVYRLPFWYQRKERGRQNGPSWTPSRPKSTTESNATLWFSITSNPSVQQPPSPCWRFVLPLLTQSITTTTTDTSFCFGFGQWMVGRNKIAL